ncbi:MAG TPA: CPBP family intramembrane glutamic endopeptidase [Actinocrinis sp.]|nr:CPBP family intramembrane glutamic endopeptidase [Actinocrinis sp.]
MDIERLGHSPVGPQDGPDPDGPVSGPVGPGGPAAPGALAAPGASGPAALAPDGVVRARAWPVVYTRRLIAFEVCAVLAVSLGRSAVSAVLDLAGSLSSSAPLSSQQATLNGSVSSQQWLNLAWQVYGVAFGLAPVLLVAYLLLREGVSLRVLGVDRSRPWQDLGWGVLVAALIGGSGLLLYLGAHAAGLALTVVPESLPAVWWRVPVLVASAFQNAALEEVVVLGYLLRRFDQAGWSERRGDVTSALIRGSYHLYQGFGGFVGNFVMGVIFARLYRRWGRVTPMLIAHGLIDTTTFVGYVFLAGHVSWLPV